VFCKDARVDIGPDLTIGTRDVMAPGVGE
jgi:hypothetical protein